MTIWVDADALPGDIKDIVLRAAERLQVPTVLVANKQLDVGRGRFVSFVRVKRGADVADAHIAAASARGDLCITGDIPLAAALVDKGLVVIDPRGDAYTPDNVGERLAMRDLMAGLREAGVETRGPSSFDAKARQRFAASFDRLLTKALREAAPSGR